ncbi:MAG: hypothetical protein ACI861_001782 [Paracoccaceae bacterium]|jgi:hypothetical protein
MKPLKIAVILSLVFSPQVQWPKMPFLVQLRHAKHR